MDRESHDYGKLTAAAGGRQKTEDRRQKTEGRRQKAEGRRQKAKRKKFIWSSCFLLFLHGFFLFSA
jgi:hypothetical protein